jgi:hypothetical protein
MQSGSVSIVSKKSSRLHVYSFCNHISVSVCVCLGTAVDRELSSGEKKKFISSVVVASSFGHLVAMAVITMTCALRVLEHYALVRELRSGAKEMSMARVL